MDFSFSTTSTIEWSGTRWNSSFKWGRNHVQSAAVQFSVIVLYTAIAVLQWENEEIVINLDWDIDMSILPFFLPFFFPLLISMLTYATSLISRFLLLHALHTCLSKLYDAFHLIRLSCCLLLHKNDFRQVITSIHYVAIYWMQLTLEIKYCIVV